MPQLYPAVMAVADAEHDGWFDHMDGLAGWWLIFPLAMMIFMVLMMSRMFFSRHDSPGGGSGLGMMGMMGGHGGENQTADDSALEVLGRRYAAGELTDEEFDAMRRRLEGG